jgi:hypothetical protein
MKPVLMIHEMSESILALPLKNYVLTFDDALYSQYYYWPQLRDIPTQKYFFVSSDILCLNGVQNQEFPSCTAAHAKAATGNYEDYMTLSQLKELAQDPRVTIGGHGHVHKDLRKTQGLQNRITFMLEDTERMLNWFDTNLQFRPTAFCYPYNNDVDQLYTAVLQRAGFKQFFGRERTPVEMLLQNTHLFECL